MPRYGMLVLAGVADRLDLAVDAALAEAARHQDRVDAVEAARAVLLDVGRLDELDLDARARAHAGVHQRLASARCRSRAGSRTCRPSRSSPSCPGWSWPRRPGCHSRRSAGGTSSRSLSTTMSSRPCFVQQHRDLVDVVGVDRRDHRALLDVREQRDLAPLLVRHRCSASGTAGCPAGCRSSAAPSPSAASAWS